MPHGDRKGPMGDGPKTGRSMGYCSGSDSPGYMTRVHADENRNIGRGANRGVGRGIGRGVGRGVGRDAGRDAGRGIGRDAGRRAGAGFYCGKTPGFGRVRGFASRDRYPGYSYPEPAQKKEESNIDFLENRIESLKQELGTLMESLKRLQSQKSDENKQIDK